LSTSVGQKRRVAKIGSRAAGGSAPSPRPYHHGNLRAALVRAATELLAAEGPLGVTLRGAARKAGVSQAAPYRHFQDKEALLAAVAEEGFRGISRAGAGAAGPRRDPASALVAIAVAYVRYAVDHPAHYRLMFAPDVRGRAHPALREAAESAWTLFTGAIERCQRAGLIRSDDPPALAFVVWAMLHGLSMLLVDRQLPPRVRALPVDSVVEFATRLLLEGLRPPAQPPRRRRPEGLA